jgi:sodium-dependent phosphate cotransporter
MAYSIVSMGQMADGPQLERAFAGATVHDCFNLLTVLVLLPVEVITHYLYHLVVAITPDEMQEGEEKGGGGIKVIIAPITDRIIKANSKVIEEIAIGVVDSCDAYYPVYCVDGIEDYEHCAAKVSLSSTHMFS